MCYSHKLVFSLKQQQAKYIHFAILRSTSIAAIGPLVDPDQEPHSEYIENDMHIAHIVLINIIIRKPVEKAVKVQTRCRVLDWTSVSDQFAVIRRSVHVDFGLLGIGGQIDLMEA